MNLCVVQHAGLVAREHSSAGAQHSCLYAEAPTCMQPLNAQLLLHTSRHGCHMPVACTTMLPLLSPLPSAPLLYVQHTLLHIICCGDDAKV
jgi:hypothetical protein